MFSLSTFSMSLAPLPPTPMPAMFNRLFAPSTFRVATNGKDNALAASALSFPFVATRNVLGANNRLNIAGIGVGGKGASDIENVDNENIHRSEERRVGKAVRNV